jgi:hypothetical protein
MPIPGPYDHKLAEIDDLHGLVTIKLGQLHRGHWRHTESGYRHDGAASEKVIRQLYEALQSYVDKVMSLAHEGADA